MDERHRYATVNITPEIVQYLGDRPIAENVPKEVENIVVPEFYSMRLATSFHAFCGQRNLVGVFKPNGDGDKRVIMFVKVDLVR